MRPRVRDGTGDDMARGATTLFARAHLAHGRCERLRRGLLPRERERHAGSLGAERVVPGVHRQRQHDCGHAHRDGARLRAEAPGIVGSQRRARHFPAKDAFLSGMSIPASSVRSDPARLLNSKPAQASWVPHTQKRRGFLSTRSRALEPALAPLRPHPTPSGVDILSCFHIQNGETAHGRHVIP